MSIAIIMPIFEDVEASTRLFCEIEKTLGSDVFIVAVDDGSVQQPVSTLALEKAGLDGVVIRLLRNVGHQSAIAVGINYVAEHMQGVPCVVMDSDGEDRPETISNLLDCLSVKDTDVVVAQRRSRVESLTFKVFYAVYKILFRQFTGRQISFGNFMAMTPSAVQRLSNMQELWVHLASCVIVSKLSVTNCPLDRGSRYAGQSKMNFSNLALHGFRAFMVFSEDVMVRVGIASTALAVLSVVGIITSIGLKLSGLASPGWFSIVVGILILALLQAGSLALITLMSLMLSGPGKGTAIRTVNYTDLIDEVLAVDKNR